MKLLLIFSLLSLVFSCFSNGDTDNQANASFSGFPVGSTVFFDLTEKKMTFGNAVEFDALGLEPGGTYLVEAGYTDPVTRVRKSTLLHLKTNAGHHLYISEMTEGSPSKSSAFDPGNTTAKSLPPKTLVVITERSSK